MLDAGLFVLAKWVGGALVLALAYLPVWWLVRLNEKRTRL